MSRTQQYRLSRLVLGVGLMLGLAALFAVAIAATVKHDHPLTISALVALFLSIVMIVAGTRMDPRESWEKAAGGGFTDSASSSARLGPDADPAQREAIAKGFRLPNRPPQD